LEQIAIVEEQPKPIPELKCARCKRIIPLNMHYRRSRKYKGLICQACDNHLWKSKGYCFERNFVRKLEQLGYGADRIPTSGSGRSSLPDVIATHYEKGIKIGFELKLLDANTHKTWTVNAWKTDMNGKVKPSQLVKAVIWVKKYMAKGEVGKAGAAIKFCLGERVKSPIIVKLFDITKGMKLKDVPNLSFDIADDSDMPELSDSTLSKRSRRIRRVRKERQNNEGK